MSFRYIKSNYYKFFILKILLVLVSTLSAQTTLKVNFEASQVVDIDEVSVMGVKARNTNLADALIDAQNTKYPYELLVNKEYSYFKPLPKISNSQNSSNINIVMNPGGNELYKNFKDNYYVEKNSFIDKQYRIKETLPKYDWKLENEKKEILGYEVRKATTILDSIKIITAWYAPKLAFKDGPKNIWGLPGLILEVEISSTKTKELIKMNAIEVSILDKNNDRIKIEEPKKGSLISREEYDNLLKEYQTKQIEYFGGGVEKD